MSDSKIIPPSLNELTIYEGGTLNEIKADDLVGNLVAVKQLINNYNIKVNETKIQASEIATIKSDLEFQKTSPFIAIVAMIVNLIGTTVCAFAINLLTGNNPPKYSECILVIGIILVVVGSLSTILFPSAKNFYNKKKG